MRFYRNSPFHHHITPHFEAANMRWACNPLHPFLINSQFLRAERPKPQSLPYPLQKIHATRPHRNHMLPIRMKRTGMEEIIHKQCTKTCSRAHIPHFERVIPGDRHNRVSLRADRTPCHPMCMPAQRASFLPRARIPHFERLVRRGRYDVVSRWADRTPIHPLRMSAQRAPLLPRVRIPHLERLVSEADTIVVSRWTDRTPSHITRMPAQRVLLLPRVRIPHLERLV